MAQTREAVATQRANETYARAVGGTSIKNDLTVIHEFAAMGINATQRVDVFTYNVWKHKKNRIVRKGSTPVRLTSIRENKKTGETFFSYCRVYHISQTDPIN